MATDEAFDPTEWKVPGQITVFVNHVDCFLTEYIAKYIASSVVGLTQMEEDLQEEFDLKEKTSNIQASSELFYRVVGTLKDPNSPQPHFVKAIVPNKALHDMYLILQQCDVIIYDLVSDQSQCAEALFMAQKLSENLLRTDKEVKKVFVAISSVLTWCSFHHPDPDDLGGLISDEESKRRRPHGSYRELYTTEKLLMQIQRKNKIRTYVVASGLIYGDKEEIFHHIFKAAWLNKPVIPLTGKGNNHLPTIHIRDLTRIIHHVIELLPAKFQYILAVSQSQNTLKEITRAINKAMGSGTIQEQDLKKILEPLHEDLLRVDLKMTCPTLLDTFKFEWLSPTGMIDYMPELINEYKEQRNLKPLKIIVLGPPGTGKTSISRRLQDSHKLHVIHIDDVREKLFTQLEQRRQEKEAQKFQEAASFQSLTPAEVEDETDGELEVDEEEKEEKEEYDAFLDSIEEAIGEQAKEVDEKMLISLLKRILLSKPFQNQGFVLDGFPFTPSHVELMFGTLETIKEAKQTMREDPEAQKLVSILPDEVIILTAEDDFLKERIKNLPAVVVEGTENEEKAFTQRLEEYRKLNTVESSIEDFLDELEFNIHFYDISKDVTGVNADIINQIKFSLGTPRTYGPSKEEVEMVKQAELELQLKVEREQKEEEERLMAEEQSINNEKKLHWIQKHRAVEKEDQELTATQALPLRHYLFKFVMPTLLDALTHCCTAMPEDPLDYLAEYLFNCNPVVD